MLCPRIQDFRGGEDMRRLHVFEKNIPAATVSVFCEPWASTIADFGLEIANFVGAKHSIYYAEICICITSECFALEYKISPGGEDMRRLHVFEKNIPTATVSVFCEPWAFTIADFPGGEDMRHLHVFEKNIPAATVSVFSEP